MINNKKGKDYGIDGRVRIHTGKEQYKDVLFSVKSGKVGSKEIRDFRGVIEREDAAAGVFITLKEPTKDMKKEAATAGFYRNEHMGQEVEKIKIVTVEQILNGKRLSGHLMAELYRKAEAAGGNDEQMTLQ